MIDRRHFVAVGRAYLYPSDDRGRADLPVCTIFIANERSDAGDATLKKVSSLIFVKAWAARQHRPTTVGLSGCAPANVNSLPQLKSELTHIGCHGTKFYAPINQNQTTEGDRNEHV